MCPDGDPTSTATAEGSHALEELQHEPSAKHKERGKLDRSPEEPEGNKRANARRGVPDQVCPEDTRDRTTGPNHRDADLLWCGEQGQSRLGQGRSDSTNYVEDGKSPATKNVLDVVPEYPQIEHVPAEVQETAVHEHRGEDGCLDRRQARGRRQILACQELVRNEATTGGE